MTARTPALRKKTAREVAEKLGVSPRTVRRYVAAPRDWWTQQRRDMQRKAASLRATGMPWAEVGKALGVSATAARALGRRGAGAWADSAQASPERDPNTADLFQKA